jgi:Vps5 C terminal like
LSLSANTHAEHLSTDLEEPLDEYTRVIASVKHAIQQRADKKAAYTDALAEVEVRQVAYHKAVSVPGKDDQATSKQALLLRAQALSKDAKTEYDQVTERLLKEFEVFKQQKVVDMRDVILNFVNIQAAFHRHSESVWSGLLPTLQELSPLPTGTLVSLPTGLTVESTAFRDAPGEATQEAAAKEN